MEFNSSSEETLNTQSLVQTCFQPLLSPLSESEAQQVTQQMINLESEHGPNIYMTILFIVASLVLAYYLLRSIIVDTSPNREENIDKEEKVVEKEKME